MEYCDNETLRQLIDAGQLHTNQERVWRLFRELVEGLEHIHSKVPIMYCLVVCSCYKRQLDVFIINYELW